MALAVLFARDAKAQLERSTFRMHWSTPEECDPTGQFGDKLKALLGTEPQAILATSLSVKAVVRQTVVGQRVVGQWQVELSFTEQGETRTRQLTANHCAELADATALLVALAVDPNVETRRMTAEPVSAPSASVTAGSSASSEPGGTPSPPPAPPMDPKSRLPARDASMPQATARTWPRFRPFLGLGPVVSLGVLPGVGVGGRVIGGFQSRHLRLALEASLLTSKPASLPGVAVPHADLYLGVLGVRPCWLVGFGAGVSLGPCAAAEWGMLWGRGEGLVGTRTAEKAWGSLRLGGHGELQVSQGMRIVLAGDVGAPFGQPRFLLAGEQVHRPSSTVGGLQILGEMHFQ